MKYPKCKDCKGSTSSGYNVGTDRYCDVCFERWMRQSGEVYQKMMVHSMSSSSWQSRYKSRARSKKAKKCKSK